MFRELLQNSDDAEARSVEIRFQTEAYLSRGDGLQSDKSEREVLPDLKTALVCSIHLLTVLIEIITRIGPPMDVQE